MRRIMQQVPQEASSVYGEAVAKGVDMTETTKAEVNELLDAFAKVSIVFVFQELNTFKREQSEKNQNVEQRIAALEKQMNQMHEALTNSRRAYKELVSKMAGNGT